MNQVLFVGWVNQGRAPVDGGTAKNQYIIAELKKYCKVTVLDFYQKRKHPWVYLQALWAVITQPHATIVLSTSASNIYGMLKWFKKLNLRRNVVHWVIGGTLGDKVKNGIFNANIIGYAKHTLVESPIMVLQLEECCSRWGAGKNIKISRNLHTLKFNNLIVLPGGISRKNGPISMSI